MTRKVYVLFLLIAFLAPPAIAQQAHTRTKSTSKKAPVKAKEEPKTTVVEPPAPKQPPVVVKDTTKKDTTALAKAADVVHDTVKAQLKAPIVQVPITLKSLIIPGVLFAYGAITLNNTGLRVFNDETHDVIWDGKVHTRPFVEDYVLLVPAAAVYGLNIAGIKGQNNFVDRSIIYGLSNAIANGFVFGLKKVGIETRPDSSDNQSFPSGHTAEAFVSAEFLHQEYKGRVHWTVIASGYAVATGVAYMRMYHNKHWLSDVVAGAGVGIASTRFSYYIYPALKHAIFGSKKVKESAMILPTYQPGGIYGLAAIYKF